MFVLAFASVSLAPVAAAPGPRPKPLQLFSPQGNNLEVYETTPPFARQQLITTRAQDPKGWDINGQICFLGKNRFISGEDTGQPAITPGWAVFKIKGAKVGKMKATRVARLTPTYQPSDTEPDNYGCGVLPDGRVVTTVIGNNASGPQDGELLMWFPPFRGNNVKFCVLDTTIGTAQGIAIRNGEIYVASARGATGGVLRYTGPFPTSPDARGGCGRTDAAGSPLVDAITRTRFITPQPATNFLFSPNAVASAPNGHWYVSSIINGIISEFDANGTFSRIVLQPPAGEVLGAQPYSTGTPLGFTVGPDGTIYYADLGLRISANGNIGPGSGLGTVRRITFVNGAPQPPELIANGLTFPDGVGLRPS